MHNCVPELGKGPPVNLSVLALLRARSRALGHTVQLPAERERARREKAREWELRKAHWRWLQRCLDAGAPRAVTFQVRRYWTSSFRLVVVKFWLYQCL